MTQGPRLTSRDLARLAGVSQSTVSRVLTDHPRVSAATRERVLAILAENNYRPDVFARAMKTGRTDTVGVVMSSVTNPLHAALLQAIGRKLNAVGLRMLLWNVDQGAADAASELVGQAPVDGLIVTSATFSSRPAKAALSSGMPTVLVHRGLDDVDCDQVIGDNWHGSWQLGRYLADTGHTKIGLISSPPQVSTSRDREAGFLAALRQAGMELPPRYVIRVHSSHDAGHSAANQLLALDDPPTAIYAITDVMALGVLDAARGLGVAVPADLWVVGFDNVDMARWESFDLTTVDQPIEAIADRGIELLSKRIVDLSRPAAVERLPCELIIRSTTAHTPPPAAANNPR